MGYLGASQRDWVCVDYLDFAAATSMVFSSSGGSAKQYPVNGNLDGGYRITGYFNGGASGIGSGSLLLNNDSADLIVSSMRQNNGGVPAVTTITNRCALTANQSTASCVGLFFAEIEHSASGGTRVCFGQFGNGIASARGCGINFGRYVDTSNITSIELTNTQSVTGRLWLYVRNPQRAPCWAV